MRLKIVMYLYVLVLIVQSSLVAQEVIQEKDDLFKTRDIKKELKVYSKSKISIRSALTLSGSINIETSETDVASLLYIKRAKSKSKSEAIDYIDIISVEFELTHDGLRLDLRAPNPPPWDGKDESGSIEIHLVLPEFCSIEFDAVNFDIDAEGPFESFILPNSFGRIYVENILKFTDINSTNRRVTARNLSGKINISTTHATLRVDKVFAPNNKIRLENKGGDIKVTDVQGELNIKNKYGRIDIKKYHPMGSYNYITSTSGPITIEINEFSTDKLFVTNSYEDIEILIPDNISSRISLAVEDGSKIEVSDIVTKPDFIQDNRLILITGQGTATINSAVHGHGNIYFRGFSKGE